MDENKNITEPVEESAENVSEESLKETTDEDDAVSEYNDTATEYAALEDALNEANNKYIRLFAEYDVCKPLHTSETVWKNTEYEHAQIFL